MAKKSFINKILQNTRKPEGFFSDDWFCGA